MKINMIFIIDTGTCTFFMNMFFVLFLLPFFNELSNCYFLKPICILIFHLYVFVYFVWISGWYIYKGIRQIKLIAYNNRLVLMYSVNSLGELSDAESSFRVSFSSLFLWVNTFSSVQWYLHLIFHFVMK